MGRKPALSEARSRVLWSAVPRRAFLPHWASTTLDALSSRFVWCTPTYRGEVLDIGCGDGIAALSVLQRGGRVLAVDPVSGFLEALRLRVSPGQHRRLRLMQATLPELELPSGSVHAIHAGHVLQTLSGKDIERSLAKFNRWLAPGGRLFVSALSTEGAAWRGFIPEYLERRNRRARWPGFIDNARAAIRSDTAPMDGGFIHLLDSAVLRRSLMRAGFRVEETFAFRSADTPIDCASCGAIAQRSPD